VEEETEPKHIRDFDYWDLRRSYTSAINRLVNAEVDLNEIIGHLDTREDEEERAGPGRDMLERWRSEIQRIRFEMEESADVPEDRPDTEQ
jgi:hypothetical protein